MIPLRYRILRLKARCGLKVLLPFLHYMPEDLYHPIFERMLDMGMTRELMTLRFVSRTVKAAVDRVTKELPLVLDTDEAWHDFVDPFSRKIPRSGSLDEAAEEILAHAPKYTRLVLLSTPPYATLEPLNRAVEVIAARNPACPGFPKVKSVVMGGTMALRGKLLKNTAYDLALCRLLSLVSPVHLSVDITRFLGIETQNSFELQIYRWIQFENLARRWRKPWSRLASVTWYSVPTSVSYNLVLPNVRNVYHVIPPIYGAYKLYGDMQGWLAGWLDSDVTNGLTRFELYGMVEDFVPETKLKHQFESPEKRLGRLMVKVISAVRGRRQRMESLPLDYDDESRLKVVLVDARKGPLE